MNLIKFRKKCKIHVYTLKAYIHDQTGCSYKVGEHTNNCCNRYSRLIIRLNLKVDKNGLIKPRIHLHIGRKCSLNKMSGQIFPTYGGKCLVLFVWKNASQCILGHTSSIVWLYIHIINAASYSKRKHQRISKMLRILELFQHLNFIMVMIEFNCN